MRAPRRRPTAAPAKRWAEGDLPAEQYVLDAITARLNSGDKDLTGTKYAGHTKAPAGLTRLQANQAISEIDRLPYTHNECRGGKCDAHSQCSRHGAAYQAKYGRAYNE